MQVERRDTDAPQAPSSSQEMNKVPQSLRLMLGPSSSAGTRTPVVHLVVPLGMHRRRPTAHHPHAVSLDLAALSWPPEKRM